MRKDIDAITQPNAKKIDKRVRPTGRRSNSVMPLPNGVRLSCGAGLECSQTKDYLRKRGAGSFRRLLDSHLASAINLDDPKTLKWKTAAKFRIKCLAPCSASV